MRKEHIPNLITALRLLLVPPVAWTIQTEQYGAALALFVTAGLSDGLDGFLARRYGWRTRLGGFLDPLADKTLMITTFVMLAMKGGIPWWLAGLVVLRDVVIMGGALAYHFVTRRLHMHPTLISKFNTVLQLVLVVTVMVHSGGLAPLPGGVVTLLVAVVTASTLLSGLVYVVLWGRQARTEAGDVRD